MSLRDHKTEVGTLGLMVFTVASVVWRASQDQSVAGRRAVSHRQSRPRVVTS